MNALSPLVNIKADPRFMRDLEARGARNLSRCMQCLKCATGCPVAFAMDYNPAQIIRMAVLGLKDDALASRTVWLCSDCKTCATRCPMEIDVAGVMDIIKEVANAEGVKSPEANTKAFHDVFMGIVRARGRMNEPLMLAHYKLRTGTFTQDLAAGKQLVLKGKIKYTGKTKGRHAVKKIMDKMKDKS